MRLACALTLNIVLNLCDVDKLKLNFVVLKFQSCGFHMFNIRVDSFDFTIMWLRVARLHFGILKLVTIDVDRLSLKHDVANC